MRKPRPVTIAHLDNPDSTRAQALHVRRPRPSPRHSRSTSATRRANPSPWRATQADAPSSACRSTCSVAAGSTARPCTARSRSAGARAGAA
ncbi:hypothetical protein MRB53_041854 [Persea americana]|nr:hypothetical protein MRB53_041854 [Persea americana]